MNTCKKRAWEESSSLTIYVLEFRKDDVEAEKQIVAIIQRHCRINNNLHVAINIVNTSNLSVSKAQHYLQLNKENKRLTHQELWVLF